eukprot:2946442-Lingulodinium_polyedra.AAC.1
MKPRPSPSRLVQGRASNATMLGRSSSWSALEGTLIRHSASAIGRTLSSSSLRSGVQPKCMKARTTRKGTRPRAQRFVHLSKAASPCGASKMAFTSAGRHPRGPGSAPATSASRRLRSVWAWTHGTAK